MITVGADVHKARHTFVAVDTVGAKIAETVVPATTVGHRQALAWARALLPGAETDGLLWAVEDCRNMSNRLERDLLAAGQSVVRVSPHLMAAHRRTGRERGKSDPIDALAVARAAQREPDLPVASHDQISRDLKLLTDHRDHHVVQRTSSINRLRWHLHELDPEFLGDTADLTTVLAQQRIRAWLGERSGVLVEIAAEVLADVMDLTARIKKLDKRIDAVVTPVSSALREIDGCGVLTAAKILGEVANVDRFPGQDQLARYCGIAPVPVWSGRTEGTMRLTRSGNRQLNRAIHVIALTQARCDQTLGHAY
ncbi:IS110 family transposase, partial [Gordonia sihwensis]